MQLNKRKIKLEEDTGLDPEILEIMKVRNQNKISIGLGSMIMGRVIFGRFSK